ncbi:MAG: sugar-binding domain-containing protein, partial [Chloroflexota bacterium]
MLYPQSNSQRQMIDLSGFWRIQFDSDDSASLGAGFAGGEIIAVPASWNDQFNERRDYMGTAWYQTSFNLPWGWRGQRIFVRFNSVNYLAEVWLNGVRLGDHEGGHLPFAYEITSASRDGENLLVVRVNGALAPDNVPPGNLGGRPGVTFGRADFPDANFDFFPFSGIQRPVLIYTTPQAAITDLTVTTTLNGTSGIVSVKTVHPSGDGLTTRLTLQGHGAMLTAEGEDAALTVPNAALWSPDAPNLYQLRTELLRDGAVVDSYSLDIGIRTITVEGDRLLLNGQPVKLLGFGRHEDFPVVGKGML